MKNYKTFTREELIKELEFIEQSKQSDGLEGVVQELKLHQIELEMQNRELKEAQEDLEFSRNCYTALYDFAPVGYLTLDNKGIIREINLTGVKLLGIERKDLIGLPFNTCVSPGDYKKFLDHLLKCRQIGGQVTTELKLRERKGEEIEVQLLSVPVQNGESDICLYRTTFTDITERKKAENAVNEARKYAENIVDTIRESLVVLDKDLRIVSANHSFYRTFQVTPEDTESCLIYELENNRWNIPALQNLLEKVLQENTHFKDFEMVHDFPEIGRKTMLLNARRITKDKKGLILLAIEDITERKLADEALNKYRNHLEAIFRSVEDGIITVDKELIVTDLNRSAKNICCFDDKSTGKSFKSIIKNCYGKECYKALKESINKKQYIELYRVECFSQGRPGQVVTLQINPLMGKKDEICGAVMVVKDETRLVEMERKLNECYRFHNIIGRSEKMQEKFELMEKLSNVPTTVLITGESGTGKELVAEALHYKGNRREKPLVKVNCSALSENLLESELFGHVKGAFTGAIKNKKGRFQIAHGGTIFLDEIGDISEALQVRLLRVLQEKEFEMVGDDRSIKVDVRIITSTNQDLQRKVLLGKFREDLYYRLKVVEIPVPPLRERPEDIPLLVEHFIRKFNKVLNKNIKAVSKDVERLFMEYPWPGNVRELEHILEHTIIITPQPVITLEYLPYELKDFAVTKSSISHKMDNEPGLIRDALKKTGWKKAKAARLLGVDRKTIYRKIKKYRISNEI